VSEIAGDAVHESHPESQSAPNRESARVVSTLAALLQLQRQIGNRAVAQLSTSTCVRRETCRCYTEQWELIQQTALRQEGEGDDARAPGVATEILKSVEHPLSEITAELMTGRGARTEELTHDLFAVTFDARGPDYWR